MTEKELLAAARCLREHGHPWLTITTAVYAAAFDYDNAAQVGSYGTRLRDELRELNETHDHPPKEATDAAT